MREELLELLEDLKAEVAEFDEVGSRGISLGALYVIERVRQVLR